MAVRIIAFDGTVEVDASLIFRCDELKKWIEDQYLVYKKPWGTQIRTLEARLRSNEIVPIKALYGSSTVFGKVLEVLKGSEIPLSDQQVNHTAANIGS